MQGSATYPYMQGSTTPRTAHMPQTGDHRFSSHHAVMAPHQSPRMMEATAVSPRGYPAPVVMTQHGYHGMVSGHPAMYHVHGVAQPGMMMQGGARPGPGAAEPNKKKTLFLF
jgi:hypothetical protein